MASPILKDPPLNLKAKVWEYFGFREGSDQKATCKKCYMDVCYPSTTNLNQHLKRKYSTDVLEIKPVKLSTSSSAKTTGQMKLTDLKPKLTSERSDVIS